MAATASTKADRAESPDPTESVDGHASVSSSTGGKHKSGHGDH